MGFVQISTNSSRVGHYSYECDAAQQERPYVSRPSRTQQLLNPKLAPTVSNEVPDWKGQRYGVYLHDVSDPHVLTLI